MISVSGHFYTCICQAKNYLKFKFIDSFFSPSKYLRDWKVSELESVRIGKCQNAFFFKFGICQNWKVSELQSVRIAKFQNWKVSELVSVRIFWSSKIPYE